jgi:hypothetical protein
LLEYANWRIGEKADDLISASYCRIAPTAVVPGSLTTGGDSCSDVCCGWKMVERSHEAASAYEA